MAEQNPNDRFKAEMPTIPGVAAGKSRTVSRGITPVQIAAGSLVLLTVMLAVGFAMRPRPAQAIAAAAPGQIEVPSQKTSSAPGPDPAGADAQSLGTEQVIATTLEMSKAWSSKDFLYRKPLSDWTIPAMLVRLPVGSATQASGYWAFATNAAYGNCRLEYITDLKRLSEEYGYRRARHPMLVNPCNRAVIDPLKLSSLPGGAWVRGEIVQGADMRPPLAIEVKIKGQKILANRME